MTPDAVPRSRPVGTVPTGWASARTGLSRFRVSVAMGGLALVAFVVALATFLSTAVVHYFDSLALSFAAHLTVVDALSLLLPFVRVVGGYRHRMVELAREGGRRRETGDRPAGPPRLHLLSVQPGTDTFVPVVGGVVPALVLLVAVGAALVTYFGLRRFHPPTLQPVE